MAAAYSRFIFGSITWYSFLITLGILLAFFLGQREEKRLGLPKDTMLDLTLIAVPCGMIGARIYYVLMELPYFLQHPLSILYIWEGGVAIYGAVIGGAAGVFLYCRKKKLSFATAADMIAPGLLLAQAIGRWGNYFNMEAFGPIIENPAFQFFPAGVQILENGAYVWHQATFFYESAWNFCGFLALMALRKRQHHSGYLILWYLVLYGSGRFIIEQLRMDSLWMGGIRVSQGLSLLLCTVASAVLLWRAARGSKTAFFLAFVAILLAFTRWFFLSSWLYLICLLAFMILTVLLRLPASFWIILPLVLDLLGFGFAMAHWSSAGFSLHLHTLFSSLTLPCYLLWLEQILSVSRSGGKGGAPCPSES